MRRWRADPTKAAAIIGRMRRNSSANSLVDFAPQFTYFCGRIFQTEHTRATHGMLLNPTGKSMFTFNRVRFVSIEFFQRRMLYEFYTPRICLGSRRNRHSNR